MRIARARWVSGPALKSARAASAMEPVPGAGLPRPPIDFSSSAVDVNASMIRVVPLTCKNRAARELGGELESQGTLKRRLIKNFFE